MIAVENLTVHAGAFRLEGVSFTVVWGRVRRPYGENRLR